MSPYAGVMARDAVAAVLLTNGLGGSDLAIAYLVSRVIYLVVIVGLLIAMYRFLHR